MWWYTEIEIKRVRSPRRRYQDTNGGLLSKNGNLVIEEMELNAEQLLGNTARNAREYSRILDRFLDTLQSVGEKIILMANKSVAIKYCVCFPLCDPEIQQQRSLLARLLSLIATLALYSSNQNIVVWVPLFSRRRD